jgi:vitamin B12/bleomycin/antimicrobial peptide transport system ATP-binding/permease protein
MTLKTRFRASSTHLRRVGALSLPYFRSEERWPARGLLFAIVTLNLATVYLLVLMNEWNRTFYDALQEKNQAVFWSELGRFCWLAASFIAIAVYKFYLTQLLEMRWRRWMTSAYLARWLSGHAFYQLELARFALTPGGEPPIAPDNPDQRIQEDVNQFTSYTVSLSMGLLNALVTLVSFIGIRPSAFLVSWSGWRCCIARWAASSPIS